MDASTQEKGSLAWTDEAKFQFLLRIVAQLKGDGRGIKWENIKIPGRTPKSLQNMWTKINKQIAEFEARENNMPVEPTKKGRPAKKAVSKAVNRGDDGLDDDDRAFKQLFMKKRSAMEFEDEYGEASKKRVKVKPEPTTDGGAILVKREGK